MNYPKVKDPSMVGKYPALAKAGGGYVKTPLRLKRSSGDCRGNGFYALFKSCIVVSQFVSGTTVFTGHDLNSNAGHNEGHICNFVF